MREKEHLRRHYAAILSSVGMILLLCSVITLSPLLVFTWRPWNPSHALAFGVPAAGLILLGAALRTMRRFAPPATLSVQEGGIVVLLGWTVVILFSSWPFMSLQGLPFSRALFESVSGWTTTGLSVVDVAQADQIILLWRSVMQLAGGAGLAIIMMSAIVGPTGSGISSAEGRSDQLVPQVRRSARLVLIIYGCYALCGALAYRLTGMSVFDAVNHAFAAVSTGGFSTHADSIGHWNRVAVEAVTLPLMLLGNLSFVTAWLLWRGRFRLVAQNGEVRLLMVVIPLSAAALFLSTAQAIFPQLDKSIRVAVFETVSALTTTGFSTVGYGNWNAFGMMLLIGLMLVGGGTCSTAGGIKQFRLYLMWKMLVWDIRRDLMPRGAVLERPLWKGDRRVFINDGEVRQAVVFIFLYLLTYALGVMLLCACGFGLGEALFEFASALGTVGLSVGVTSAQMPDIALWGEIFAMFLGRLEFMVVIVSLLKIRRDSRWMLF